VVISFQQLKNNNHRRVPPGRGKIVKC